MTTPPVTEKNGEVSYANLDCGNDGAFKATFFRSVILDTGFIDQRGERLGGHFIGPGFDDQRAQAGHREDDLAVSGIGGILAKVRFQRNF